MSGNPRYPLAEWTPTGLDGGSYIGGPPRGVWHETITAPSAFFTGATYYHIQFRQWPLDERPRIRQFIPFDRASRALRNLRPGANPTGDPDVQTNRQGSVNINAALVGYQTARSNGFPSLYPLTDAMLNELYEFMEWCRREWGIPLEVDALIDEAGQQEYGYDAPHRFSADEWRGFSGWCGHERVTENTHHDPYWRFGRQIQEFVATQIGDEVIDRDAAAGDGGLDVHKPAVAKAKKAGAFSDHTQLDGVTFNDELATILDRLGLLGWRSWTKSHVSKAIAAFGAGAGVGIGTDAVIEEIIRRLGG